MCRFAHIFLKSFECRATTTVATVIESCNDTARCFLCNIQTHSQLVLKHTHFSTEIQNRIVRSILGSVFEISANRFQATTTRGPWRSQIIEKIIINIVIDSKINYVEILVALSITQITVRCLCFSHNGMRHAFPLYNFKKIAPPI